MSSGRTSLIVVVNCGGQNATPAAFLEMFSSRGRGFSSRGRTRATPTANRALVGLCRKGWWHVAGYEDLETFRDIYGSWWHCRAGTAVAAVPKCHLCSWARCTSYHTVCLFYFLAMCARLSCILSFRVHVKLFYRIVSQKIRILFVTGGCDSALVNSFMKKMFVLMVISILLALSSSCSSIFSAGLLRGLFHGPWTVCAGMSANCESSALSQKLAESFCCFNRWT